jgi:hypothetical protein
MPPATSRGTIGEEVSIPTYPALVIRNFSAEDNDATNSGSDPAVLKTADVADIVEANVAAPVPAMVNAATALEEAVAPLSVVGAV